MIDRAKQVLSILDTQHFYPIKKPPEGDF